MKFKTAFSFPRDKVRTESGERIKKLYGLSYDDKGVQQLIEKGKVDLYNEIQSHADSCDINILLTRFCNGDVKALNKAECMYGDFTNLPSNYAEMLNVMSNAQDFFNTLTNDVKAKFNNSPSQFIASLGSSDLIEKLGFTNLTNNFISGSVGTDMKSDGSALVAESPAKEVSLNE